MPESNKINPKYNDQIKWSKSFAKSISEVMKKLRIEKRKQKIRRILDGL
jgi:hypothetical protein